jgi:hypothetical protein
LVCGLGALLPPCAPFTTSPHKQELLQKLISWFQVSTRAYRMPPDGKNLGGAGEVGIGRSTGT